MSQFSPEDPGARLSLVYGRLRRLAESLTGRRERESGLMVGFGFRRAMRGGGVALALFLSSAAAANAGACDAKKARSLVGKQESPRLEETALALSGASVATLVGQGFSSTADYRTDRLDIWLDRKGNVVGFSCG